MALVKSTARSILEFESTRNTMKGKLAKYALSKYRSMTGSDLTEAENLKTEDMHWYYDVARYDYQHDIWLLSRPFIKSQYYEDIVRKRQMNYRILKRLIHESKTLKPVFPYLSSGVCPLCFPIIVHQSDRFVRKLNRRGILPFVFGRFLHPLMNKANYPDAYFLSKSILGLPVHQQLGRDEMYSIDEAINEISRKNGKTN